jgi:hypothetical protein
MSKVLVNFINQKGASSMANLVAGPGISIDAISGIVTVSSAKEQLFPAGEVLCVVRNSWQLGYEKIGNTIIGTSPCNLIVDGWKDFSINDKIIIDLPNGIFGVYKVIAVGSINTQWKLEKIDTPQNGAIYFILHGKFYGSSNQVIVNGHCATFSQTIDNKIANVGDGVTLYTGRNPQNGNAEFATLNGCNEITIAKNNDTIGFSIDYTNFDISRCKGFTHWCKSDEIESAIIANNVKTNTAIATEVLKLTKLIDNAVINYTTAFTDIKNTILAINTNYISAKQKFADIDLQISALVNDNEINNTATWSSQKINDAINKLSSQNANKFNALQEKINMIEQNNSQPIVQQTEQIIIENKIKISSLDSIINISQNDNAVYISVNTNEIILHMQPTIKELRSQLSLQSQKMLDKIAQIDNTIVKHTIAIEEVKNVNKLMNEKINQLEKKCAELYEKVDDNIINKTEIVDASFVQSELQILKEKINSQETILESIKRSQSLIMSRMTNLNAPQQVLNAPQIISPVIPSSSSSSLILPIASGECRNTKDNAVPTGVSYFEFISHFTLSGDFTYSLPKTPAQGQYIILHNNTAYAAKGATFILPGNSVSLLFVNGVWRVV